MESAKDLFSKINFQDAYEFVYKTDNDEVVDLTKYVRRNFTDLLKPYIDAYGQRNGTPIIGSTYYEFPASSVSLKKELHTTQDLYIAITMLQKEILALDTKTKDIHRSDARDLSKEDMINSGINKIAEYEIYSILTISACDQYASNISGILRLVIDAVRNVAEMHDIATPEVYKFCDDYEYAIAGLKEVPTTVGKIQDAEVFGQKLVDVINHGSKFEDLLDADPNDFDLKLSSALSNRMKANRPERFVKWKAYQDAKKAAIKSGKSEMDAADEASKALKDFEDNGGYQKALDRLSKRQAKRATASSNDDDE